MENPISLDDLEVPLFLETPKRLVTTIYISWNGHLEGMILQLSPTPTKWDKKNSLSIFCEPGRSPYWTAYFVDWQSVWNVKRRQDLGGTILLIPSPLLEIVGFRGEEVEVQVGLNGTLGWWPWEMSVKKFSGKDRKDC